MSLSSIGGYTTFFIFFVIFLLSFISLGLTLSNINCNPCFVTSMRKRQSVVCRYPDGRLVLYCKVIVFLGLNRMEFTWLLDSRITHGKKPTFYRVLIL
jgi:hypothetical protein